MIFIFKKFGQIVQKSCDVMEKDSIQKESY